MGYSKRITKEQRKAIKNARRERTQLTRVTEDRDAVIEKNLRAVRRYGK